MRVAKCRQQSLDIVDRLMRGLPYGIQHGSAFALERGAALTLMTQHLPVDSGKALKEAAARLAVEPILKRNQQYLACQALLQELYGMMPRANQAEKESAWRSLAAALEKQPVGTAQAKLEEERDKGAGGGGGVGGAAPGERAAPSGGEGTTEGSGQDTSRG